MATNYSKPGRIIDWTNGTGGTVTSGSPVVYGLDQMGIALGTVANGGTVSVALDGEFTLPKLAHNDTGALGVAGQPAYWLTDKVYDAPGLGRRYIGVFGAAAAKGAATCVVQLRPFRDEGPRVISATITAAYTVTAADLASGNLSVLLSNAAAQVVNLPSVAVVPRGAKLLVRKTGGNAEILTLTPPSPEQIAGGATDVTIAANNKYAEFQSNGAAWLLLRTNV